MEFFDHALGGFLSVNKILFNIGDYPLSYIECVGTVAYFLSVWLMARKHMLTWPIGILSVVLFGILFYQIQLYADAIEQVYYLFISFYGWLAWEMVKKTDNANSDSQINIASQWSAKQWIAMQILVIALATAGLTYAISQFHVWLPQWFGQPADYPLLDALTTVMSFVAMYLLTIRRHEAWVYWIIVDVIGIWLYWTKGVKFISIQYVFLLGMACYGLYKWQRSAQALQPRHH